MHENFFHKLKVYYEDTDSGGVVYYANYLKYLERARTEALFSIGFSNKKIQDNYSSLIIVNSLRLRSIFFLFFSFVIRIKNKETIPKIIAKVNGP